MSKIIKQLQEAIDERFERLKSIPANSEERDDVIKDINCLHEMLVNQSRFELDKEEKTIQTEELRKDRMVKIATFSAGFVGSAAVVIAGFIFEQYRPITMDTFKQFLRKPKLFG